MRQCHLKCLAAWGSAVELWGSVVMCGTVWEEHGGAVEQCSRSARECS